MKKILGALMALLVAAVVFASPAHAETYIFPRVVTATTCKGVMNSPNYCRPGETVLAIATDQGDEFTIYDSKGKALKMNEGSDLFDPHSPVYLFTKTPIQPGSYSLKVYEWEPAHWSCSKYDKDVCKWVEDYKSKGHVYKFNFDGTRVSK